MLYLPLPPFEYAGWMELGRASGWTAMLAFVIGGSYPLWSALYHKQPKTAEGPIPGESATPR
jgi:hypothetical protein